MIYFLPDEKNFALHTFASVRLHYVIVVSNHFTNLFLLCDLSLGLWSLSLHSTHIHLKTHSVMRGLVGGLGGADRHLSLPKGKASYSPEHSR